MRAQKLNKRELKKLYKSLLPVIRDVARGDGYAIGEHGSMTRDMDLLAVKWNKDAKSHYVLAGNIALVVRGTCISNKRRHKGRWTYTIVLPQYTSTTGWSVFIDLSIAY